MSGFFNAENFLWKGFAKFTDFLMLSMFFFLASIPIVTIPAAAIALYDATARCVFRDEPHPYGRFFRTYKSELRRSIGLTVLWGILALVLRFGYQFLAQMAQSDMIPRFFALGYYFMLFIPAAVFCWLTLAESRYVYGFAQLHKAALYLTFRHFPTTVVITGLVLVAYEFCVRNPFLLFIVPGIVAYLQAIFAERVLKQYLPKEESPEAIEA